MNDYSDYEDDGPGGNLLAQITATAQHQLELEEEVQQIEIQLKIKKAELATIAQKTLPELMDEARMSEFRLIDGRKVAVKMDVRANISRERAPAACKWLRDNSFGALIKNVVTAEFGVGEDQKAQAAISTLKEKGLGLVSQSETVNHQTLSAWVRGRMEADPNEKLPVELLGINVQKIAQIK